MNQEYKYMVYVSCKTYNHAPYIKDALDGFCMQQTTFPFVCGVIDDASTDGEPENIRQYIEQHFDINDKSVFRHNETDDYEYVYARHKENRNCYFVVMWLKYNHHNARKAKLPYMSEWRDEAKYIALCEGDDCWIDSRKLQLQVDFMEEHPDYSLVHTDFVLSSGVKSFGKIEFAPNDDYFPSIITGDYFHPIATLTVMYRLSSYNRIPRHWIGKGFLMGDKPLWIELAREGKIKYLNIKTARYSILQNSASHSTSMDKMLNFYKSGRDITLFYARTYGVEIDLNKIDKRYLSKYMQIACKFENRDYANGIIREAIDRKIVSCRIVFFYIATFIPPMKNLIGLIFKNF